MIVDLPDEILYKVAAYLDPKDIRSFSNTCKKMTASLEYLLWTHMIIGFPKQDGLQKDEKTYWKSNGNRSVSLLFHYEGIYAKTTQGSHVDNIQDVQSCFPNITTLQFDFEQTLFPIMVLFENGPGWQFLTSLILKAFNGPCIFTRKDLVHLFQDLPNLVNIGFRNIDFDRSASEDLENALLSNNLQSIAIKDGAIPWDFPIFLSSLPDLCSLYIDTIDVSNYLDRHISSGSVRSFLRKSYTPHLETADIRLIDKNGTNVFKFIRALNLLIHSPLKYLSMAISILEEDDGDSLNKPFLHLIYALQSSLKTLCLNLSTPFGKQCFILDMPLSPYLRELTIRYPEGSINFSHVLSQAPGLKKAILELRFLLFEVKLDETHNLESIELIGLSISRQALDHIAYYCIAIKTINMSPTVQVY
ncbi:hypothetical protein CLU79DRAFT_771621 [Phycomyces nitens]|nr:hypothetical protein CLU79DRAFT_771621 [Phycomyces nitens]